MHERIKLMLETQDPDIIIDLRKTIGEKGTKFDIFWNEIHDYFNEVIANDFSILYALISTNKIFIILIKVTPAVHD